ncbi:MAG: trehalose-phosphatase [Candidatus Kaelpia aquatica]|nr:trehalose-phosphatase [Candidatus Kaelpia aquatica]
MSKSNFDAVIFDLDGVITDTAVLHVESWKDTFDDYLKELEAREGKEFREFTHKGDYLPYVDGKPRYEGVRSFLSSRGIEIPFGDLSDEAGKETICGLGNKKNEYFLKHLKAEGADLFKSTLEFIKKLHERGIKTAVASSSKNCKTILESVGIEDMFQSRVDGVVSVELGLKGKPEADIFLKAASNIGVEPSRSVVVEDATSGVEAGRNGGFGLVIGIARESHFKDLLDSGADVVVSDLADMSVDWVDSWFKKRPREFFSHWDKSDNSIDIDGELMESSPSREINPLYLSGVKDLFKDRKPIIFLDYDGTLTPIVAKPELAVLSKDMREIIKELISKYTVAIVSGRGREDVENLVNIEGILYAGNHGFDIKGPDLSMTQPDAEEAIPAVKEAIAYFKDKLSSIDGLLVEEKKFSVAVHYRLVDEDKYLNVIEDEVNRVVAKFKFLRLMHGKKVFEVLPNIYWNKGCAIRWIVDALKLSFKDNLIVYIGDDTTDEDAFRAIRSRGCSILVAEELRPSAADFWVKNPNSVKELFEKLLS